LFLLLLKFGEIIHFSNKNVAEKEQKSIFKFYAAAFCYNVIKFLTKRVTLHE